MTFEFKLNVNPRQFSTFSPVMCRFLEVLEEVRFFTGAALNLISVITDAEQVRRRALINTRGKTRRV